MISGGEQRPSDDIQSLLRAIRDDDIVGRCFDTAGDTDVTRDGFPEAPVARGTVVHDRALGFQAQLAGHQLSPRVVRKQRRIGEAASEVETNRLGQHGGQLDRIPDGARAQRITDPLFVRPASRRRQMLADDRASAHARRYESFPSEPVIYAGDCRARDRQLPCEFPAGRQWIAGPQLTLQDRPPQLPVDLAAEVLAANQADVKLHCRTIRHRKLACQTLQKLALAADLCRSYLRLKVRQRRP